MIELVKIDIYLNYVIIASGIDEKEFDLFYYDNVTKITDEEYKLIRKDIADPDSCNGLTVQLDNGNVFVFIRKGHERKDLCVSHELYHATNKILMRAGVHHDEDDEPFAYLLGYLINEYYVMLDDMESKEKQDG